MIRTGLIATLLVSASPGAAESLVGEWHCIQDGPEVRVEADTRIEGDGAFTAEMEFTLIGPNGRLTVTAIYAAEWMQNGDAFVASPLGAKITGVFLDGEKTEAPQIAQNILRSLQAPSDTPMQIDFDGPDVVFFRSWDGNGAPFECIRADGDTIGL